MVMVIVMAMASNVRPSYRARDFEILPRILDFYRYLKFGERGSRTRSRRREEGGGNDRRPTTDDQQPTTATDIHPPQAKANICATVGLSLFNVDAHMQTHTHTVISNVERFRLPSLKFYFGGG